MNDTIDTAAVAPTLRTDIWLAAFDGSYRFALPPKQMSELQHVCGGPDRDGNHVGKPIFRIYGAVTAGRYALDGKPANFAADGAATYEELIQTVRLALIGGRCSVVGGNVIPVTAAIAARLITNYLEDAPIDQAWNLAFAILDARVNGRPASEAEIAADPAGRMSLIPAWAGAGADVDE